MAVPRSGATILVVDDSPSIRRLVCGLLEDAGFTSVLAAADGAAAWEELARTPVHVVVCDAKMPRMSGLELLRRVREDGRLARLPFILLTSDASEQAVLAASTLNVSAYVVKPFDADLLLQAIDAALI